MKDHKRENKALRVLIKCAVILAAGITAVILSMLFLWCDTKDNQIEPQTQKNQTAPLVITTPAPATKGSIRVFDYDGCCIYAYYGEIKINSDGRDGKEIDIVCEGYLEGYQQHGEPVYTEESEEKENE